MNKKIKKRLITLTGILIFIIIAGFILNIIFSNIIDEKIKEKYASLPISEFYNLYIKKITINPILGNISLNNISLSPKNDSVKEFSIFKVQIDKLQLKNVSIYELVKNKNINIHKFVIRKPDIYIEKRGEKLKFFDEKEEKKDSTKKAIKKLNLSEFSIQSGSINFKDIRSKTDVSIKNVNINVSDFNFSDTLKEIEIKGITAELSEIEILKKEIEKLSIENIKIENENLKLSLKKKIDYKFSETGLQITGIKLEETKNFYAIDVGEFKSSYKNKSVEISNFKVIPTKSEADFMSEFKLQQKMLNLDINKISVKNLEFDSIFASAGFYADEINISDGKANIYTDKQMPFDYSKRPKYPAQQVREITKKLKINLLKVENFRIAYRQKNPNGNYGKVVINRFKTEVKNITNLNRNSNLTIKASGYVQNKMAFGLNLIFNYKRPEFSYSGQVEKTYLRNLNTMVSSFAPIKFNKGVVNKMIFSGFADAYNSNGKMLFLYDNLDFTINLDKGKNKDKLYDFLSFLANSILSKSNPHEKTGEKREPDFRLKRNTRKGFINVLLESVIEGIKQTLVPQTKYLGKNKRRKKIRFRR